MVITFTGGEPTLRSDLEEIISGVNEAVKVKYITLLTHGGFLSGTHAASCALFTLIELVEQLRGDAGPRQVAGAEIAFACGVGGVSQAHYAAVLGRG